MRTRTGILGGLVTCIALTALPAGLEGQYSRWAFDADGGLAVPVGSMSDVVKAGAQVNLVGSLWLSPAVAFRVGGGGSFLGGKQVPDEMGEGMIRTPTLNLWHYHGGFEFEVTDPGRAEGWDVDLYLAAGGVTMVPRRGTGANSLSGETETFFGMNAGIKVMEEVHPTIDVFISAQWFAIFFDEDKTDSLTPGFGGIGTSHLIPFTVGFRVRT